MCLDTDVTGGVENDDEICGNNSCSSHGSEPGKLHEIFIVI